MSDTLFTGEEWLRYSRHIQLPNVGAAGQTRLKQSHVMIVGMGGLGAPVSLYLAAAGIGHLTLFDGDTVDLTNLQRQVIYTHDDIGKSKAQCAKRHLQQLNTAIHIDAITSFCTCETLTNVSQKIDLILDCTDNFAARYLINDFCVENRIPWLYASIHQFSGQCALFSPGNACFRCVFPAPPDNAPDCNTAGVIGVLPGLLGLLQANEAIKLLAGLPSSLNNQLLLFDALNLSMQKIQLAIEPSCFCQTGNKPTIATTETCASEQYTGVSVQEFKQKRDAENVTVIDVRSPSERQGFHIGGEHIPIDDIDTSTYSWQKDTLYMCYCQSGARSANAAKKLNEKGIQAVSLDGGLMAWLKAEN